MSLELEEKQCLLYKNMDLLGKKWMIFLLLEFGKDTKKCYRYSDFEKILPGVTSRAISMRLSELVKNKLVIKNKGNKNNDKINICYNLTSAGIELIPIIKRLQKWSAKFGNCKPFRMGNCSRCSIFKD